MDWGKHGYRVTSHYGNRPDPFGSGRTVWHTGIDLVKSHKAPIYAFVGGTVTHAKMGQTGTGLGGFGIVVVIVDKYGAAHLYAHLDSVSVSVGGAVKEGQEVGKQGNTGQSTGSHLHYEVRSKSTPSYGYQTDTDPGAYLDKIAAEEVSVKIGDEDKLELTKMQQTMLVTAVNDFIKQGVISDKTWAEKAEKGTLTVSELTWLNTIALQRLLHKK